MLQFVTSRLLSFMILSFRSAVNSLPVQKTKNSTHSILNENQCINDCLSDMRIKRMNALLLNN